jgi:rod shape-determining protein MreD
VRIAGVLLAIALALALQTLLARFVIGRGFTLDLVLVVVVTTALTWGPAAGLLTGMVGGLAQDALSGGIIGVGGVAKTLVGFLIGIAGSQFIVTNAFPRFCAFFGATVLHAGCFIGLYSLVESRQFGSPWMIILTQALGNGIIGLLLFRLAEGLPGAVERGRSGRGSLRKRWVSD